MIDTRTAAYGALVLRVALGVLALSHGLHQALRLHARRHGRLLRVAGLSGDRRLATPWRSRPWAALALILGFYARVVALLQIPILLGATLVHLPNGWMFANPNGGFEYPLFWAAALLALVLLGPGAFALRDVGAARYHATATARTA